MRRTQWMALSALVVISGCTLLQPNQRLRQALAPRAQQALPAVEDFASARQEAAAVAARDATIDTAALLDGDRAEPAATGTGLFVAARLDDRALETVRGDRPLRTVELADAGQANGRLYAPAVYVGGEITDNWAAARVTAFDAPALSALDLRVTASLVGL